jgi:hypothetical protein
MPENIVDALKNMGCALPYLLFLIAVILVPHYIEEHRRDSSWRDSKNHKRVAR